MTIYAAEYGAEGNVYTFVQIGVNRLVGLRVDDVLEGAESDRLPDGGCADLHCGWSRRDHDPSTCLNFPQTAPIDEVLTRQVPGLCTPG